jgi:hypothetical protein
MSFFVKPESPIPFILAVLVVVTIAFMVTARQPRR